MSPTQSINTSTQTNICPVPSEQLRSEVRNFANKTNSLVRQILGNVSNTGCQGPVVITQPSYVPFPYYPHPRPIFVTPGGNTSCPPPSSKKGRDANFALGAVATVIGLGVLYSVGSGIGSYQEASYESEEVEDFMNQLNSPSRIYSKEDAELVEETRRAAELRGRISNRIKSSSVKDILLRVTALAGVSTLAGGAYLGVPEAISAGAVTSVAALAGIIFKWGLNSSQRANERDAEALQYSLDRLYQL